ncbi:hypothetical protein ABS71_14455 [bacterium SCN 62-11]|nr:hypothetical protein [Candidatus Eremiobacteraeota bacterium]ODT63313.1 MAG: hypothetical protein ABS71_14455 [bacterium SCN 62-11]
MDFGCVFTYSWLPPQLNLLAFAFLTLLAVRYPSWPGHWLPAALVPWLWFSQAQPGPLYYLAFALLVFSFRLHWHKHRNTLRPRLYSYLLAGYLGYASLPALAGVPTQLTHSCTYCRCNLRNLATAIDLYREDHRRLPASLEQLTPTYLNHLPTCISANPAARVFYRGKNIQIGDGYIYQRLPNNHYLLRCPNRGISGHDLDPPSYQDTTDTP